MDIYAHVSKKPTKETANRFADFMGDSKEYQESIGIVKTTKKQTPSVMESAKR
ncbi:hypothetical protein [Enterococcus sp. AZ194]|uniref:hypothetical protein n=1 Tax=Enterococcus sp. AZ194 TaxID=2774629 RepID=UPI003F684E6D